MNDHIQSEYTMKTILFTFLAIVTCAWYLALSSAAFPPDSTLPWIIRQEGMYLTGLLSIALMSLSMLLSARPLWLEKPLGGLDRIYRLHKWSGILAIGFGASHWLLELSSDLIKPLIGSAGRLPKIKYEGLLEVLRKLGDDMGEWALYAALVMLVITLAKPLPEAKTLPEKIAIPTKSEPIVYMAGAAVILGVSAFFIAFW